MPRFTKRELYLKFECSDLKKDNVHTLSAYKACSMMCIQSRLHVSRHGVAIIPRKQGLLKWSECIDRNNKVTIFTHIYGSSVMSYPNGM